MDDIRVRVFDFGTDAIEGATVLDKNGDYNICINESMSFEIQNCALQHELRHISNNDFFNGKSIKEIGDSSCS